jgi:hypothetical protein
MVTVLYVEHLATMGDIPEARGESNPQTISHTREQGRQAALEKNPNDILKQ